MIIDSKGKFFGKVSIVDLLIVVILIAGVLGAYYKFGRPDTGGGIIARTEKVSLTFYMEDVANYVANSIKVGDLVKDKANSVVIGKVTDVKTGPDIVFNPDSEGKAVSSSKPGYVSIQITVEGQGSYSDTGVLFSNVDYYVNKQFELRVGIANLYPRISSIKKIEG